ncbi:MAG TPA: ABC transporter ATP-binding protein [Oligoflexus sp.]|uniref:ABC transporter ATP-binding protein n=1 Tax=Oligoflexus sp. TaxID=1971216 RepID=UPI002D5934C1|nr:ABC transporter ATP-binding protein [Oligoflexus sp.]HYX38422.1 ABC transporter ATP-binding protein [Oligoflexus sp.]
MRYSPARLFLENLRTHRLAYSLGLMAMLITSISEVFLPKFIQWSIDVLTQKTDVDPHGTLDRLVLGLVLMLTLGWLGRIGWRQILARQTHLSGHEMKTRLWSVLKDQPLSVLDRFSLGDLMNRATADWNKTRFIHGFTIVLTFDLIFFSTLSVISMLMIHVKLALLCLCVIPFLPRNIIKISRQEYTFHQLAQEQLSLLSDLISQTVKTIRLQRATASEKVWQEKLQSYATEYAQRQFKVLHASWRIFVLGALPTIIAYGILFTYGVMEVQAGRVSIGAFIALQSYVLLLQSPLFELGSVISEWQTGFASFKRLTEVYNLERDTGTTPEAVIHRSYQPEIAVRLQELFYSYDQTQDVLNHINLSIPRGEKLGLIGPIGSGKSTLVNIIGGLLEHPRGLVQIHGLSLEQGQRDWIVKQITMVPQKPFLFAGTIRHNLSPMGTADEQAMIQALQVVELWDDVQKFTGGLDCWIGEWGINLSGGQKQRLSLARALLKPSPILILDDCLSAVDSITEAKILAQLQTTLEGHTVIWTAHRLSTLQLCDHILRLEDGRLHWDAAQSIGSRIPESGPRHLQPLDAAVEV